MARGRSTAARTQAREAARARKAAADAERRERDQIEEGASVEFELARGERDAADQRAAEQVRRLDSLPGMRIDRIAALLGESSSEIKRLRKLLTVEERGEGGDTERPTPLQTSAAGTAGSNGGGPEAPEAELGEGQRAVSSESLAAD